MSREQLSGDDALDFALGDDGAYGLDDGQSSESPAPSNEGAGREPSQNNGTETHDADQLDLFDGERGTESASGREQQQQERTGAQASQDNQDTSQEGVKPLGQTGFFTNAGGDIVDRFGTVIAKAGAERRLFDRSTNLQEQLRHKDSYIQRLESENKQFKDAEPPKSKLDSAVEQLGFNEQEVTLGLQLTNMWKRDPLNAVAHMFAEARKMGYDDQRIGQAIQSYNPAANPATIETAVNRAMQPILERVNQSQQPPVDERQAVQNEITEVFAKHDGAYLHQDALVRMIRSNPSMKLEDAVKALKGFSDKHRLDWWQPLGPQIEARRRQQTQPRTPNTPDVPGRSNTRPAAVGDVRTATFAEPDDDWGSIVRSAMGPRS